MPSIVSERWPILAAIERSSLALDAGMGTRLVLAGLDLGVDDPALWNLSHPDQVAAIHSRDIAAGADAVVTNTFGANRRWLARFDQVTQVEDLNRRAVALARSAAGDERFVIGSIGPSAGVEAGAAAEQAAVLVGEGVDAVLLETFRYPAAERVLEEVIAALSDSVPVFVSLWDWSEEPRAAERLLERGAAVLGFNCGPLTTAAAFAVAIGQATGAALLVKPGSGPGVAAVLSAEELAAAVPALVAANVRLIGGCCGTDERHVAAVAECLRIHRVSLGCQTGDQRR